MKTFTTLLCLAFALPCLAQKNFLPRVGFTNSLNASPIAAFTATPTNGATNLAVAFDASASTGTAPLTYHWRFMFTNASEFDYATNDPAVSFTYSNSGTYSVSLVASNLFGVNTNMLVKHGYIGVTNLTTPELNITNGAIAYYRMDSGTTWTDESGNGRTLTENGTVTGDTGIITNAGVFTGNVANFLSRADEDGFSAVGQNLTVAAWAYHAVTNNYQVLVSKYNTADGEKEWLLQRDNANTYNFMVATNGTGTITARALTNGIAQNVWVFVVGQLDITNKTAKVRFGTTTTLYDWGPTISGFAYGPTDAGTNTIAPFRVGKIEAGTAVNGRLDEVFVTGQLLTDQQITNLWNGGAGKTWPLQ